MTSDATDEPGAVLTDAEIEEQRHVRVLRNGRTPLLRSSMMRSKVSEMRRTIGKLGRQCDLMDEQCHLLDIAIDNGIHITHPEMRARSAESVANHYRLQYEEMRIKRDAALRLAEERAGVIEAQQRLIDAVRPFARMAHPWPGTNLIVATRDEQETGAHDLDKELIFRQEMYLRMWAAWDEYDAALAAAPDSGSVRGA